MNYENYRQYKDTLNLNSLSRLDCMNPFAAMKFIYPSPTETSPAKALSSLQQELEYQDNIDFTSGVREALKTLVTAYPQMELMIPAEVYPVYFQIAKPMQVQPYSIFTGFPFRTKEKLILITLNTFGTLHFSLQDIQSLIQQGNIIILDAIYDFQNSCQEFYPLIQSGQFFLLNSYSKTHLIRNFGYVLHQTKITFSKPLHYYNFQKNIPQQQLEYFQQRWQQLDSILETTPSKHPYFRIVDTSFSQLLANNILGVPLSVFSEQPQDTRTVLSCLYNIDVFVSKPSLKKFKASL